MACIEVNEICKRYADVYAVNGISFKVDEGEVFGLLGPNGAGKTTTIRMLLDIIKQDSGSITIFGKNFDESTKAIIGYLPEERGLYEDLTVMGNIIYLAALKGIDEHKAKGNALVLLKQVDLLNSANKKVKLLSKGMKQLVQVVATLAHDPKVLVLDEPFSGLDPANREVIKRIILDQKRQKRTIILSTHLMDEVEQLCDRILMINRGRRVLYGSIEDIKERYATNSVSLEFSGKLPQLGGIEKGSIANNSAELFLRIDTTPQQLLKQLVDAGVEVKRFDVRDMSLNQIFIQLAEAEKWIKV
jgi:ABC-2 type transport system ATP-binding protein